MNMTETVNDPWSWDINPKKGKKTKMAMRKTMWADSEEDPVEALHKDQTAVSKKSMKSDEDEVVMTPPSTVPDEEVPADLDSTRMGHLFLLCIQCSDVCVIMFTNEDQFQDSITELSLDKPGIVITVCKQCMKRGTSTTLNLDKDCSHCNRMIRIRHTIEHSDTLKRLILSPKLISTSTMYENMYLATNREPTIIMNGDSVAYKSLSEVMDKVDSTCTVASLHTEKIKCGSGDKIIKPFLSGNFW